MRRVDPKGRAAISGIQWVIGIVVIVAVIGLAITLFHFLMGYGLLFLAAIGAIVLIRQIILGRRMSVRLDGTPENKRHVEKRAHKELKQMEQKLRR